MKAFAHYTFYNYRFDDVLMLPANVAPRNKQQGVRVGITVWTPVLR